jgi:ribose transport system substrate-binding protein
VTSKFGKYYVPIASRTLDVLEAFRSPQDELTLEQIRMRTGVAHTTAFRILYTLVHRRYLTQTGKRYRLNPVRRKIKIGFGTLSADLPFAVTITQSLRVAANAAGMELIVKDNQRDPQIAIENAHDLVSEGVDVAIEFQRHEHSAPVIADIFATAGIPTIAVHIPQPGAVYFGADNYRAGWTAGVALAEFAKTQWHHAADLLVLLDIPQGGMALQSRMTGVLRGLESVAGPFPAEHVVRVDGRGTREASKKITEEILQERPQVQRLFVGAASDESALGAVDALREAGLAGNSAVVGHDGEYDAVREVLQPASPFIGTVAFFPERYGRGLVSLVLRLLKGEPIAPFHYIEHELIDRQNAAVYLATSPGSSTNLSSQATLAQLCAI